LFHNVSLFCFLLLEPNVLIVTDTLLLLFPSSLPSLSSSLLLLFDTGAACDDSNFTILPTRLVVSAIESTHSLDGFWCQ
jgi:hypothetical protein